MTRWGAIVALALALCALLPRQARADTPDGWTAPTPLGPELPSSWFPDLYADRAGNVRVVWSSNLEAGDGNVTHDISGAVMLSELRAGQWSAPADLAVMDAGTASRPFIVSDGAYAHLIYRTERGFSRVRLVYQRAPLGADIANAQSWSAPLPLTTDETYWAQLIVLSDDTLVVAYNQEAQPTAGDRRPALYVRRSTDHGVTWSPPVRVSSGAGRVARVSLAWSPDSQTIVAAWDEGYDNLIGVGDPDGVATAVSHDAGETWSPEQFFPGSVEQSVVATNGATSLLVYRSTTRDVLLYRVSDDHGLTWSAETPIPSVVARPYTDKHNFDKLSLAVDGDGRFLLAYIGTDDNAPHGLSVMVASYADDAWAAPRIVAAPDGFPEYPRIVIALGNQLTLVYFVRDNEFDVGHYTLWAVSATTQARAIAPTAVTPATPVVVVTPTPAPVQLAQYPPTPAAPTPLPAGTTAGVRPEATGAIPLHRALRDTLYVLLAVVCVTWLSARVRRTWI